jgi:hypothetical protein
MPRHSRKSRSRRSHRKSSSCRSHRKSSSRKSHKKMTAYCVGCGKPHNMGATKVKTTRNNRKMLVGKCSHTGVKMCRFI